jgi:hypothetical protein
MLRIWVKVVKNNKIIIQEVVTSEFQGNYQDNLKICITELCYKFDIEKPYWLPYNLEEFNKRSKTSFNKDNFIDLINFDSFMIEEIKEEKINKK